MYKPTITDAVRAYYKRKLNQYNLEYLEMLQDVIIKRIEEYEALRIEFRTSNVEVMREGVLLRRVRDAIVAAICLQTK